LTSAVAFALDLRVATMMRSKNDRSSSLRAPCVPGAYDLTSASEHDVGLFEHLARPRRYQQTYERAVL
jgi:hypothetical protein